MKGGTIVDAVVRGLHDVFAAMWAGGLLTMVLVVMPTVKSMKSEAVRRFIAALQKRLRAVVTIAIVGVFATGVLMLRLALRSTGGLDPQSLYGALMIAKIGLSLIMVVIAAIRFIKLRRLGDGPAEPRGSGVPLLVANAALVVVVLLLSGATGAIGA